ncbi:MAG: GNVR domain-containing protein [Desulfobulbus sp.]|nr:GNVR domain-containing protein [Desulfobulbus sp.]
MMDIKQRQLIKKYVDLVLHSWRLSSIFLLIGVSLGLGYYFYIPKIYQSTALLSFEAQQINPAKMDPEQGRQQLRDSLATLQELVTSRTSLEKVIMQFSLYEGARKQLPLEDVIEMMRKNIDIKPVKQGDIFNVSFQGADPVKVVRVANALASLFIEENLKYREERATETSKYTEDELALSKKVLDAKEQQMRDYKLKYFNEMPEQRQSNLAQLRALVEQSQGIQTSIQDLERTKVLAQEQARLQQQLAALSVQPASPNALPIHPETDGERLQRLQTYLAQLQGKYTEMHPEVRRTQQQIAQLEAKGVKATGSGILGGGNASSRASIAASLESQRVQAQIKQIDLNIDQLRQSQAAIPAQITQYQKWVEAAPVREAEWNILTRDYSELRRHYDQLVANNLQAQSAENLERNQKGSKFKIVDSARLSEKPFKPNFVKILLVAVVASLGLSVGSVLAMDFIDTSFKDVGELEEAIGVPVICAIPFIEQPADVHRDRLVFLVSIVGIGAYSLGLIIVFAVLWTKGLIII